MTSLPQPRADVRTDPAALDAASDLLEERGTMLSFGSLRRTTPGERHTDVLLSYAFPLGELDDVPLITVLHLVLSGGSALAEDLG